MGADLLLTWLVIDKKKTPDIEAGREFVRNLPAEKLSEAYEEIEGSGFVDYEDPDGDKGYAKEDADGFDVLTDAGHEALRTWAVKIIDQLDEEVINPERARDMCLLEVRGAHVYITGGMSWGDSPTEAFNVITAVFNLGPGVFEAMGFEFEVEA